MIGWVKSLITALSIISIVILNSTSALSQSGVTVASETAPRQYFAFYPDGENEASLDGYLASTEKLPYTNFPIYDQESLAPMGFIDLKKVQSIRVGPPVKDYGRRTIEVVLSGQKKPVKAYLHEGLLVSDSGLIIPLWKLPSGGILKKR